MQMVQKLYIPGQHAAEARVQLQYRMQGVHRCLQAFKAPIPRSIQIPRVCASYKGTRLIHIWLTSSDPQILSQLNKYWESSHHPMTGCFTERFASAHPPVASCRLGSYAVLHCYAPQLAPKRTHPYAGNMHHRGEVHHHVALTVSVPWHSGKGSAIFALLEHGGDVTVDRICALQLHDEVQVVHPRSRHLTHPESAVGRCPYPV